MQFHEITLYRLLFLHKRARILNMFKNLSKENRDFYRRLVFLAPPVVFSELLNSLVNILDTLMIGRAMGIEQVTAVALANQIFFVYVVVFWGIVGGCGIFIGQYWGKGERHNIQKTVGLGLSCSMVICLIFFIPCFFFPRFMIGIFSQDPVVIEYGAGFLQIMSLCYFFVAITFTRNGSMRNTGQTKLPMVTTSAALIINLILNYLFIFVLGLPLTMVALGTVIARFIELCLQQYFIVRYDIPVRGNLKQYLSYDLAFVKKFFKVSIYLVLGLSTWSIGTAIYHAAYAYAGTNAQGAVRISGTMAQLFMVFGMALGVTTQIIMSNTLGSGDRELAIRYSRKCMALSLGVNGLMSLLMILSSPLILIFFDPEPEVRHYVLMLNLIFAGGLILRSTNFVNISGTLRSGGDTRFNFWLDIVAVWCIGIPIAFITAAYFGMPIYWVVLLVHFDEIFKFILGTRRVFSNKWANRLV